MSYTCIGSYSNIKSYLDEVKTLHSDAGFFAKKEIENYFPRLLNWDKINKDPEAFKKTLEGIYKSLNVKNPKEAAETYLAGHKIAGESVFNRLYELSSVLRKCFF